MTEKTTELTRLRRAIERIEENQRAQTEALEELGDRLAIQNAVLLEVVATQQRANRVAMGRDPDDWPSPKSRATTVEDNVLHLLEGVDLQTARRYADE